MDPSLLRAVAWYRSAGYSVFPVDGKRPLLPRWQEPRSYPDSDWGRATGIALVAGPGFCVVDVDSHAEGCPAKAAKTPCGCADPASLAAEIGETVSSATPSGGRHLFFSDPDGFVRCTVKAVHRQVDTRGQGRGYVVVPPSPGYSWLVPPIAGESFAPVPAALRTHFARASRERKDWGTLFASGSGEGNRHASAASLAGYVWHLVSRGDRGRINADTLRMVRSVLADWDTRNVPPLGREETDRIAKTVGKTHYDGIR